MHNNVVIQTKDLTDDDNWEYSFTGLDKYDKDSKYYVYKVKERQVPGYAPNIVGNDITNIRSEKTSIEITKGWLDGDSEERPDKIIVYVYQNEKLFDTVEVEADKDWVYELTNIEAYDEDGQPYTYTVKEKDLIGYDTTVAGFNITNLRVGKIDIEVDKVWIGPKAAEVEITLYADGEPTEETLVLNEVNIPKNYKKSISEDGLTVTNKYEEPINPNPVEPTEPGGPEHEDGNLVQTGSDINFLIPIGIIIMLIGLALVLREKLIKE